MENQRFVKVRVLHEQKNGNSSITDKWAANRNLAIQFVKERFPDTKIETTEIVDTMDVLIG